MMNIKTNSATAEILSQSMPLNQANDQNSNPVSTRLKQLANISAVAALFFLPLSTSLLYLTLLLAGIAWLFDKPWQEKLKAIQQNPGTQLCLGFFSLFLLGSLYSAGSFPDILASISKMSKFLYVIFLVPIFKDKTWRHRAIVAFVAAMLLSLLLGLLKLNSSFPLLYLRFASPATVFKSYIDTNLMMAFSVFILAHLASGPIAWQKKMVLTLIAALMTVYVLWWSEGRSGYFVFVALWLVFCFQKFSLRTSLMGVMLLALVLGCATHFSYKFQQRLLLIPQQIQQYKEGQQFTSVGQRLQYFQNVFVLAKERSLLGFGTGSLKSVYGNYAKEHQLFQTQNPHNEYLNIFFQLGAVGVSALIGLFIMLFYLSFRMPKLEGHLLQGACVAMALGCMANSWVMDFTPGFWFVLMMSLCFGSDKKTVIASDVVFSRERKRGGKQSRINIKSKPEQIVPSRISNE